MSAPTRTGNRILDMLPADESRALLSTARTVPCEHGLEVYRQDGELPHVYFPTSGVFGVVIRMEDSRYVEGTTIGKEGLLGLPVFLGVNFHPFVVVAQVTGESLQLPTPTFLQLACPGSTLNRLLHRYTLYRLRSANQTGACNSQHSVEERMSRWLLMAHDRAGKDEFGLTHEFLAELLGVRRQTVSIIAGTLQRAGFINYRRGVLRVLDREGLESASCECYEALKQLYERVLRGNS